MPACIAVPTAVQTEMQSAAHRSCAPPAGLHLLPLGEVAHLTIVPALVADRKMAGRVLPCSGWLLGTFVQWNFFVLLNSSELAD